MITTSRIKAVKEVKEWSNDYGTFYQHLIEMLNGDKIEISKKKKYEPGQELTYEIVGDPGQHEFTKAKTAQKPQDHFKAGKGSNASFALSYAKDIAIAAYENGGDKLSTDNILAVASKFNKWLNEN